MKPQTGILISVHSYSKQYIQFFFRVRVYYRFTHRGLWGESPRHTATRVYFGFLGHLFWQRRVCFPGIKVSRVSPAGEGKQHAQTKCSVLGSFFSRAVNPRIGKLLIKCGIHIGLSFF